MKRPAQVRADFILKLQREGQRLPRRQEAEAAYVDARTALVTHEEVRLQPALPSLSHWLSTFGGPSLGRWQGA